MTARRPGAEPEGEEHHAGREQPHSLDKRRLIVAVAYAALFVSLAFTTLRGLVAMTGRAFSLQQLPYRQRRTIVNGSLYVATRAVRATVSDQQPLALIVNPDSKNIGLAILADYYLYPHPVKLYFRRSIYDADKSPTRPVAIAYVDIAHSPELRRATYAQIRATELGESFVVRDLAPNAEAESFIVPLVASADGPPPDVYTTEGVVENDGVLATRVAFEMFPSRRRREITLQPRQRLRWNDVLGQLFGADGVGWMSVHAERPIRFQFWFVNQGRKQATALAPFASGTQRASVIAPRGAKLWILNPNERDFWITVNGERRGVPFFSLTGEPAFGTMNVSSELPIVPYVSWRDSTGRTLFRWPENQ
jgi:hypothetical protein